MESTPVKHPLVAHICVCTWRELDVATSAAINQTLNCPEPRFTSAIGTGDALISRARSQYATRFLRNPDLGEVLLFVDSDIVFEPRDAVRLVTQCRDGYPIIGGLYVTRSDDAPRPAARLIPGTRLDPDATEPIEIIYAATGFLAIHREVLEDLAETLPLCRTGSRAEMYPFFPAMPFDHSRTGGTTGQGWEYLSEDWGFCQLARDKGYKIWLDPALRLGHYGQRQYRLSDVYQRSFETTYLTVTEGSEDKARLLDDLARHREVGAAELVDRFRNNDPMQALIEEWRAAKPQSADEVRGFWATSAHAADALALYSVAPERIERLRPVYDAQGIIVDLDGGAGGFTLEAMYANKRPVYVNPKGPLRDFAESRFAARSMRLPLFDRLEDVCGPEGEIPVDSIVACDTLSLSHPERARELVARCFARLRPDGRMIVTYNPHEEWPFHFNDEGSCQKMLQDAGFVGGPYTWRRE